MWTSTMRTSGLARPSARSSSSRSPTATTSPGSKVSAPARRVERPPPPCYLAGRMDTARGPQPARGATAPAASAAEAAYDAPLVQALLATPHGVHHREVPRARQIFVNRNLRMDKIEAVGFDMDYTVAMYHLQRLETLAFRMTLARMIEALGYPAAVGGLQYDPEFVIRGLVVDKQHGNIFKMDRHNHVGRCYHGRRRSSSGSGRRP